MVTEALPSKHTVFPGGADEQKLQGDYGAKLSVLREWESVQWKRAMNFQSGSTMIFVYLF